ncbi:hypothetical protein [Nocardioides nitrophenolicus]|uniref:hypothetical protein n=1 Tax=Nocardioides nitrophenolicus TaxID=60489 RepID=UPI00195ADA24|nr:hypothetical protein [Nocardioides nitrophenolicus]MBM7517562.1 DNA polymerase-3 subunit epsilon [Nocardioides nitrophenolicus]
MTEDLSLFGDDESAMPPPHETGLTSIADWQVDLLRKALDARGLKSMTERQRAVEAAAGRRVDSLRALSHDEALRVLSRLGQQGSPGSDEKSAWDDRDGDTWIDKL